MSTVPLAKAFDPTKFKGRVLMSEKLDGVPVRFDFSFNGPLAPVSRQNKPVTSLDHIHAELSRQWERISKESRTIGALNAVVVGEVTHTVFNDFKDISGAVRANSVDERLRLNVFDGYLNDPEDGYFTRIIDLSRWLGTDPTALVRVVPQRLCPADANIEQEAKTLLSDITNVFRRNPEGLILRDATAPFKPGTRHWDYQKYVIDPTIELRLHSVVEGKGSHAGSVGRMNFWYKDEIIGVGPGKLTHAERRIMWQSWSNSPFAAYSKGSGPIATIQYKRDDSYDALRQPTFQHWRHDKDTADA